jgi:Mce-associated membrane protein
VDAEEPDVIEKPEEPRAGRFKGLTRRVRKRSAKKPGKWSGKVGPAVLALICLGSLLVLGGLFWFSYRPDRAIDAQAAKSAIAAASDGTIAILSYSPDTLDRDFSSARSHLTGDFLSYYDQFTQQIVAPAAKQKAVKTTAVVLRGALTDFHPDSATVLLFINQSTQSRDRPEPTTTSSSVLVTLTKADGKWLISQFNPA